MKARNHAPDASSVVFAVLVATAGGGDGDGAVIARVVRHHVRRRVARGLGLSLANMQARLHAAGPELGHRPMFS